MSLLPPSSSDFGVVVHNKRTPKKNLANDFLLMEAKSAHTVYMCGGGFHPNNFQRFQLLYSILRRFFAVASQL